jgi:hypothetical protein
MEPFEDVMRRGGQAALEQACRFHMGDDPVHKALVKITRRLNDLGIPYAIVGGMALAMHGFVRATVDVDLLVTSDGLKQIHEKLDGLGYVPPFTGSKQLRDTEYGVKIEFLVTGGFPGDGKPKPVAFPDPAQSSIVKDGIRCVTLETLLELKLASGMSNVTRAKDIGDVVELIRNLKLSESLADTLNPYVREKYLELWRALRDETYDPQA